MGAWCDHLAATVLSFGNGAFEGTVLEGMIFHFHGEPLVIGI